MSHPVTNETKTASFEVSVGRNIFNAASKAILNVRFIKNQWDVEYFMKNLQIAATRETLLVFCKSYSKTYYSIVVRDNGTIPLCEELDCSSISLTENNILRVGCYDDREIHYCDINGSLLCRADIML